jgi:hypothetical protein
MCATDTSQCNGVAYLYNSRRKVSSQGALKRQTETLVWTIKHHCTT